MSNSTTKEEIIGKLTLTVAQILNSPNSSKDTVAFLDSITNLIGYIYQKQNQFNSGKSDLEIDLDAVTEQIKEFIEDLKENEEKFNRENEEELNRENEISKNDSEKEDTTKSIKKAQRTSAMYCPIPSREAKDTTPNIEDGPQNALHPNNNLETKNALENDKNPDENNIEYKNIDYNIREYSTKGLYSFFTSEKVSESQFVSGKKMQENSRYVVSKDATPIYCKYNSWSKKYLLIYRPKVNFNGLEEREKREIGIYSRGQLGSICFELDKDQLEHIALSDNTEIITSENQNIMEIVNQHIRNQKGQVTCMPKAKIPFYKKNVYSDENDMKLIEILYDYIYMLTKTGCFSKDDSKIRLQVANSNNETTSLNLKDVIYLANNIRLNPKPDIKRTPEFHINVNNLLSTDSGISEEIRFFDSDLFDIVINSADSNRVIHSSGQQKEILNLDIKDGLSSASNIKTFAEFVINRTCKQDAETRRMQSLEYSEVSSFHKTIVEQCDKSLEMYKSIEEDILNRLRELYRKKFGEEMSLNGEEFGTRSGSGRGGRS